MSHKLIAFLTLFYSLGTSAQTLRECIKRALENNYELQIVRNEEEIARNNVSWANAGGRPTVDASASYRPSWQTVQYGVARGTGEVTSQTNTLDNALSAGVSLDWTLFDGYKIQTNYKQYQLLQQQGELATRIAIEDLIADVASEYYYYVEQVIKREHNLYSMNLSRERLRIAQLNYETGRFSGLDKQLAQADFHTDSASYMSQDEVVTASRIRLNNLMANKKLNDPIALHDTCIAVFDGLSFDVLWEQTLRTNSSLIRAVQNTQLAELDLKKVLSRNYPYLKLNAQYGYNHTFYGRASNTMQGNLGLNAGLTVGINLFDGNRRRERRNAEIVIQNRKLQSQQMELDLQTQLTTFWKAYENDLKMLCLQRENLEIAKKNFDSAMERYKLGDLSGFDMRQVQKNLLDAEDRLLMIQYDAKVCEISLLLISGTVTEYLK